MDLKIPRHIAIIMDGNGRWAKKRGMPRTYGHKAGVNALRDTLVNCGKLGVKYLSVYAFSTENWKRNKDEVDTLMFLFKTYLKNERKKIHKNNIRFLVSGRKIGVNAELLKDIEQLENETKNNTGITLNIAFNYGGRAEIVDAITKIIEKNETVITEDVIQKYLYNNIPDPELLIRTSGELRVSNFMLWQIAYSEIYITDTYWPDFNKDELLKAIRSYNERERRFGGIN